MTASRGVVAAPRVAGSPSPGPALVRLALVAVALVASWFALYRLLFMSHVSSIWRLGSIDRFLSLASEATLCFLVIGSSALGTALLWRSSEKREARTLAIFLMLFAFAVSSDGFWTYRQVEPTSPAFRVAYDVATFLAAVFAFAALVRFSVLFPRAITADDLSGPHGSATGAHLRRATDRLRVLVRRPALGDAAPGPLRRLQRALLDGRRFWIGAVILAVMLFVVVAGGRWLEQRVGGRGWAEMVFRVLQIGFTIAAFAVAIANFRVAQARASDADRRRLFWVLEGCIAFAVIMSVAVAIKVLEMAAGLRVPMRWFPLVFLFATAVVLVCLAIAMFRAGAFDPALAIRRTAIAGVVTTLLVFLFAGVENLVQGWLGARLGFGDRLGGLLTGGTIGLAAGPLQAYVSRTVERLLTRAGVVPETDDELPTVQPG